MFTNEKENEVFKGCWVRLAPGSVLLFDEMDDDGEISKTVTVVTDEEVVIYTVEEIKVRKK